MKALIPLKHLCKNCILSSLGFIYIFTYDKVYISLNGLYQDNEGFLGTRFSMSLKVDNKILAKPPANR